MTREQIEQTLSHISYKPGWRLNWLWQDRLGFPVLHLRWEAEVVDAYDFGRRAPLTTTMEIPHWDRIDQHNLLRQIFEWTVRLERHEAGEFFKLGTERPFDPHD